MFVKLRGATGDNAADLDVFFLTQKQQRRTNSILNSLIPLTPKKYPRTATSQE
jgi:hypothetical protein